MRSWKSWIAALPESMEKESDQDKLLLYCVVGRKEIVALKELVDSIDPDAFVIVSDVREVLGEGFIERK